MEIEKKLSFIFKGNIPLTYSAEIEADSFDEAGKILNLLIDSRICVIKAHASIISSSHLKYSFQIEGSKEGLNNPPGKQ